MKKYPITLLMVAIMLSACGGGGGGGGDATSSAFDPSKNLSPSPNLSRRDLKIDKDTIGNKTFMHLLGFDTPDSSIKKYTPDKEIDFNEGRLTMGNSMLTFNKNGTVTLDTESCITTEYDCSLYREAALAGGYVKVKKLGASTFTYEPIDKMPYRRRSLTLSNTQKYMYAQAETQFNNKVGKSDFMTAIFGIYHLDAYNGIKDGDRSQLYHAAYYDILDGGKDMFSEPSAKYYWSKDGVASQSGNAVEYPYILGLITHPSFSKHARLGLFMQKTFRKQSGTWKQPRYRTQTLVHGTQTPADNLSKVAAAYKGDGAWHGLGRINAKTVYLRGDVHIRFDTNTQKVTQFDVDNTKQYELNSAIAGFEDKTGSDFLPGVTLKLENTAAVDYEKSGASAGQYAAILTENGGSRNQYGKFFALVRGGFFGTDADVTAGTFVMQKRINDLKDREYNTVGGGYIAKKD